jgi:predicted phage terminase large subunit-like protein
MSIATIFKSERDRKVSVATAIHVRSIRAERKRQSARGGLYYFVKYFWRTVEPNTELIDGWCLFAICQHLEAVHYRDITRLLMNVPPGSMKSLITNVFYPAWAWSAGGKPGERFLSFSYASFLSERDNERMLMVLKSSEFKEMWGGSLTLTAEGKVKISNNHRGWKFATSVGGVGTGERGSVILFDDPHPVNDSQKVIESTVTWFRETLSNRLNDMRTSAIVVIMQRISEEDVSGAILDGDDPYVHLMIPMLYEPDRHCETDIGWSDPRTEDGECYWPERFPPEAVARCQAQGAYAWNSQYQQRPEIRGGGLIKRDWWQEWSPKDGQWPRCEFTVASLDPAFTAKTSNDPSGFTIWGSFRQENGDAGIILLYAFREHLELHGGPTEKWDGETDDDFRARCKGQWGLVETVDDACKRFKVNHLLIEAKGPGHSVAQEMRRLHRGSKYSIELVDPKGLDKTARIIRIQPMFSNGQIFAPFNLRTNTFYKWAQMVIDETAIFPKGKFDDLCDSLSQSLWYLRCNNFAVRRSEQFMTKAESERNSKIDAPLYPT